MIMNSEGDKGVEWRVLVTYSGPVPHKMAALKWRWAVHTCAPACKLPAPRHHTVIFSHPRK